MTLGRPVVDRLALLAKNFSVMNWTMWGGSIFMWFTF